MATILRFDHVGITVSDLDASIAFFERLGLEVEWRTSVEGEFLDTVIGLDGARTEIAMLVSPGSETKLELSSFHRPEHTVGTPDAVTELGLRNICFEVDDLAAALEDLAALGYDTVGGVGNHEGIWLMAYVRGPDAAIVSLAQLTSPACPA